MANYKRDVAANRDALFGDAMGKGTGKSGGPTSRVSSRSTSSQPNPKPAPRPTAAAPRPISSTASSPDDHISSFTPGPSKIFGGKISSSRPNNLLSILTGQAKIDKMAEAQDHRLRAQKAMTRGVFSRPDPISAANYYKRAADAYKQCGENRLERLHRIASGDCQMGQNAYASAAADYTRAAELAEVSEETLERKRQECHKLHLDAANAWASMGEKGRAAEATMKGAFGLIMGDEIGKAIDEKALTSIEQAIESFVPDPLNRKRNYRRTGKSIYEDENAVDVEGARRVGLELAKQNIITDAFAHETLFLVGVELIKRRHYESALYAYGAGTASLEAEGIATVSLGRAYLSETILTLAMGDTVAASQDFQQVHLQRTSYLSSRECALAEDLIRACTVMDLDALDDARSKTGPHRSAMANLDPVLRQLVGEIRVSGRAKKGKSESSASFLSSSGEEKRSTREVSAANTQLSRASAPNPPRAPELTGSELQQSLEEGFAEMDDIMNEMGLNDDEEEDFDLT
ncbi:hypothetical protein ACHAW6_016178 [Cyclotella cf. meneghiniana]